MKKYKYHVLSIMALLTVSCVNLNNTNQNLEEIAFEQFISGQRVDIGIQPIQILEDGFDVTNGKSPDESSAGGAILYQTVEVFKLQNGRCLSLTTLFNDSGVGGYQSFIVFKNNNIIKSLQRKFATEYIEAKFPSYTIDSYYKEIDDTQKVKDILQQDFGRYKSNFNKEVLSGCQ
ncbi:hypothetical protein [Psychrobacter sp. I-STPA6b]|uniref:hypothetical protein n=1 Tax=Psychrobacter sp. I-STPA6b TaxID=2585718 RepID=UPI001D0C52FB|nr:hypothetical protein [Psychrobacter sp. I-STPA6b]